MKKKIDADYPYGLSLTLCGLGVMLYAYLAFMGLNYHYQGVLWIPAALTLLGVGTLVWCLRRMCRSKRQRQWRRGMWKEIGFLVLAFVVLALGSVPLSRFMHVYDQEEEMREAVNQMVTSIRDMDASYRGYTQERINLYDSVLTVQKGRSAEVRKVLAGETSNRKRQIRLLEKSLERRLMPEGFDTIMQKRHAWLLELDDISVWNLYAPKNIKAIGETGQRWADELTALTWVRYYGEVAEPFEVPQLTNRMQRYQAEYTRYCMPDWRGYLAIVVGLILIMMPYLVARRPKTGSDGTHV